MSGQQRRLKKWHITLLTLLALIVAGRIALSMTVLNDQWVIGRIQAYAKKSHNADLRIGALAIEWRQGTADAKGVEVRRADQGKLLVARMDHVSVSVEMRHLLRGQIRITDLEVAEPRITTTHTARGAATPRIEQLKLTAVTFTDVHIQSSDFALLEGAVEGTDVEIHRTDDASDLHAYVDRVAVSIETPPGRPNEIHVRHLELIGPRATLATTPKEEGSTEPTIERLKNVGFEVVGRIVAKLLDMVLDMIFELLARCFGVSVLPTEIHLDRLEIHRGSLAFTAHRQDNPLLSIDVENIEYSCSDAQLDEPLSLLTTADLEADLHIHGAATGYRQHLSGLPRTVAITQLNLAAVDPLLRQKDAIVVESGMLNAELLLGAGHDDVSIRLTDLALAKNTESAVDDFLFVPVDKLITYVNDQGGQLELAYRIDPNSIRTTADLQVLFGMVWTGMWQEIVKQLASDRTKDKLEGAKAKLEGWYKSAKDAAPK